MTFIRKKERAKEKNKHPTILKIPDGVWDEIKGIFPKEKPLKTVGRPIIPYRKVIDGILYSKNRVSMETTIQRIWFWLYLPPSILGME